MCINVHVTPLFLSFCLLWVCYWLTKKQICSCTEVSLLLISHFMILKVFLFIPLQNMGRLSPLALHSDLYFTEVKQE